MNSSACAALAASRTCSSVASGRPRRMFSVIEVLNRNGSWFTMPMWLRRLVSCSSLTSWPSISTRPAPGS